MNSDLIIRYALFAVLLSVVVLCAAYGQQKFQEDIVKTSGGDLKMTFIAHGTLMFTYGEKVIHIDPVSMFGTDYSTLPKANLILVTHEHGDHLDPKAIQAISTDGTTLITNQTSAENLPNAAVMKNGDTKNVSGITIEAVPAYNVAHTRDNGEPFHPKGTGNGYVIEFGGKRVYVGGDTENVPEMKNLKNIEVAFLPMNLPYTMTPEMVADAVSLFHPKILYPYHFGQTDTQQLVNLLRDQKGTEVRIRKFY